MAPSNLTLSLFIFYFLVSSVGHVIGRHHLHRHRSFKPTHLFVFGDSYADTGNIRKAFGEFAHPWNKPYGMSYPGKPTGRFSDGLVLTDFIAIFLGLKTPWPYQWRKMAGMDMLYRGMNVAYGGSGVFDTFFNILPNMSTQIDLFQKVLDKSVYTKEDLESSVAFVSCVGNDYAVWLDGHQDQPIQNIKEFIPKVVNELARNLKRLQDLGIPKILVTGLHPIGCSPRMTSSDQFKKCNSEQNLMVKVHNVHLDNALIPLNNVTMPHNSTFFKLDLYDAFDTVISAKGNPKVNAKFENPLVPACMAISKDNSCGDKDATEKKLYNVSDPEASLIWDSSHPTQMGWKAIFKHLQPHLTTFFTS